jgi:hypothetical protein
MSCLSCHSSWYRIAAFESFSFRKLELSERPPSLSIRLAGESGHDLAKAVASRPNGGMVRTIRRDFIRTRQAQ